MGEEFTNLLSNMAQLGIQINASEEIIIVNKQEDKEPGQNGDMNISAETEVAEASSRSLRKRSGSEDSLHRTRNRKIQRPKKNASTHFESDKDVKNFYLNCNKKFRPVKPMLLETIFEADESLTEADKVESPSGCQKKDSGRKHKRCIAITDGINITKALKDKRKLLIKKHMGNKKKPKRIALAKFMEYFKEKNTDVSNDGV